MRKVTLADRMRYAFDNMMSRGTVALVGWLALISIIAIIITAGLVTVFRIAPEGSPPLDFFEAAWVSLMRTLDAGTMGGDTGWSFRIVMFVATLCGIFVISTLIGVLTAGIEGKIEELRKGRSSVIEKGHTVILGWSPQVFSIVSELVIANANQPRSCIVILGEKDKVDMESEIRERVGPTGRTRVVCRTGNPIESSDLEIVSLHTAKSVIVLSPEIEDPDSQVIKTVLAIVNSPSRRPEPYHIVAEIRNPKNAQVAKMVGRDEVEVVLVGDLIARIIAQTCRQSGLSVIYTELLDFGGDEIYFKEEQALVGKTFGESLLAYEDSAVIGLCIGGVPHLNPPMDTRIRPGDQIIAIAEDDDTIRLSGLQDLRIDEGAIRSPRPVEKRPEHTLILGWNWRAPTVIRELDHYTPPGSRVTVVADCDGEAEIARLRSDLQNQAIAFQRGDTTDRRMLDGLGLQAYDRVIVLCYDGLTPQQADARTLVTLLHLRDIAERCGCHYAIVSEMLDIRNRNLAEVTRADDFIVSDKLVSLMLSQVSENKALNAVLADIFDPEGSEIYIKPAGDYVELGKPVNFYTIVEAGRRRNEIAIGYRLHAYANDAGKGYGIVLNPDKSDPVMLTERDRIIVISKE